MHEARAIWARHFKFDVVGAVEFCAGCCSSRRQCKAPVVTIHEKEEMAIGCQIRDQMCHMDSCLHMCGQ